MKILSSILTMTIAFVVVGSVSTAATAAPITYDFTGTGSGNHALGASHIYTASGGPNITAISGSYTQSGSGAPVAGDAFGAGGQLVGNNRGADEMGVGVCFNSGCNGDNIDDHPEIDASGREAVRLDISSLLSGFGSFTINADSATGGEVLGIFASNAAGTTLGAKLADATSAGSDVSITPTSNYLFLVADNTTTSGADVLLHSLTVTANAVPEPTSLALLGAAFLSLGLMRWRTFVSAREQSTIAIGCGRVSWSSPAKRVHSIERYAAMELAEFPYFGHGVDRRTLVGSLSSRRP
jgi:PEP-CTERM motif